MSSENRTNIPNSLNEHWMPFTSNKDFKKSPRLITEAKGVYLKTHHGKTQIDASSGLFCNPLGHGRKEITEAVTKQLDTLDYAQPFQQGFGGSFELATRISKHTPGDLNKMFFTICGSTAVETAIKIAVAYHRAKGNAHRFRFVGRERAYHGMNIGCVSVGGMINNVKTFASILMPGVQHMRHTHLPEHKFISGQPESGGDLANDLERIATNFGPENIAACIVEPIAGSTGTLVPPKGYLKRLREICDKYGILLIFDEVITGYGRLGKPFAAQYFDVMPDIIISAKGLTNGVLPMGAVFVTKEIHDAFMNGPDHMIDFFHGYTYSGHPMACAAALATMETYQDEGLLTRAGELAQYWEDAVHSLKDHPYVIDIRNIGLVAAIELESIKGEPTKRATEAMDSAFFDNNILIRTTGDIIALSPPLIIEKNQIDEIIDKVSNVLKSLK